MKSLLLHPVFALSATIANGALVAALPFQGDQSESFESFTIGTRSPAGGPPISILGGVATMDEGNEAPFYLRDLFIYVTANDFFTRHHFGVGPSSAKVADGNRGMGHSSTDVDVRIDFNQPVIRFGGYWGGSATLGITFAFFNAAGESVGAEVFIWQNPGQNGVLEWAGWEFSEPVARIEYHGAFIVTDSLRIDTVPEPATLLAVLPASLLLFGRVRRSCTH